MNTKRTILFAVIVASLLVAGVAGAHERRLFGKTFAEWMQAYHVAYFSGTIEQGEGHMQFMPIPAGELVSGSFTSADPALLVGHQDATIQKNEPWAMTVALWYGERYNNGLHDDPVLPDSVFKDSYTRVTIDGQDIINSDTGSLDDFYFGPQSFDPPFFYSEPTNYGSVATVFIQGLGMIQKFHGPGVHTMHLQSEIITFIPDYYAPGVDLDLGVRFDNTWTITVE